MTKIRFIPRGLVLVCGWLVILAGANFVLTKIDPGTFPWRDLAISMITVSWLILTMLALGVYFYQAWQRAPRVSNKTSYIAWLSFETACTMASVIGLVWLFAFSQAEHTPRYVREATLRQDLLDMRAILNQYAIDKHQRPQSLHDLVESGYLKQVPTDPITRRNDQWILEWSNDSKNPGIVNIRSSSRSISTKGNAYRDW